MYAKRKSKIFLNIFALYVLVSNQSNVLLRVIMNNLNNYPFLKREGKKLVFTLFLKVTEIATMCFPINLTFQLIEDGIV